ncbi:MAG: MarR family transcriptional regulator [Acidobacteriia bacterium]|nr:MarR family transcriptional regulator [Terriglobia bacterium]
MIQRTARCLSALEYRELAEFRYQIRRFLHFSESAALAEGVEPRQHQALLAIKALPEGEGCAIAALARTLFLRHQSTVGLVDRLESRRLVARRPNRKDARQVMVALTRHGESVLRRLSLTHRAELERNAPQLARALRAIMRSAGSIETR